MTVKQLIELNDFITDICIEQRIGGSRLLDALYIGADEGQKPPYPMRVPINSEVIEKYSTMPREMTKEALYIHRNINAWDDGKDYHKLKLNTIPKEWLSLEVYRWDMGYCGINTYRRREGNGRNVNFHGQKINIVALPDGYLRPQTYEEPSELDGQMSIEDFL